ncbi:nucleoside triphosphate pyrophosphohydrolase [Vibrio phage K397]|nr:hypothetical protein MYOV002v2_p0172 [Vibrio phage 144E46.1]
MNKNTSVKPLAACHIIEILRLQVETNEVYDANWRSNNTLVQFKTAANVERSEMHDEVETLWKWYEPNPVWAPEKALFELVDTVHFAASCILVNRAVGIEDTLVMLELGNHVFTNVTPFNEAEDWWSSFMHHVGVNALIQQPCESLAYYIGSMLSTLGYTPEQYMKAHYMKNERNRARASGGVMSGGYDKSTEKPLEL